MLGLLAIFIAQVFYIVSDIYQKEILAAQGFSFRTLISLGFIGTLIIGAVGFVFQMYALSKLDLSRTIILLSVLGVVMAAIAGVMVFHDKLHWYNQAGVVLAVVAIVLVRMK